MEPNDQREKIFKMVLALSNWIQSVNFSSYDWWDIWSTSYGGWAKSLYLKNGYLGKVFISPIILLDLIYPNFRRFFAEERPFSICYAHIGLGYISLYELTMKREYLEKAESLVNPLMSLACNQTHGPGWGINLKWRSFDTFIQPNAPCITQTAYVYEFISKLYEVTENKFYFNCLEAIANHVANDYSELKVGNSFACSYFSNDKYFKNAVVNANSYRAMVLIDAGIIFNNIEYLNKGKKNLQFVLSMQDEEGSWPYSTSQGFVDHYHTCFVLKNLYKILKIYEDNMGIENALTLGLHYYFSSLLDELGYPIPFSVKPRMCMYKYDSYDLAESISLLAEMNIHHDRIYHLCQFAHDRFKTKDGWFIFRLYPFPHGQGIPYMRYANSAIFLALTKVLSL